MPKPSHVIDLEPARRLLDRHLRHDEPYDVVVDSLRLTILPGVFCPTYTRTSGFLARQVEVLPGESVLDMFSGSGYQGLVTARRSTAVVCVDWSPVASECATLNAQANGLADRVTVRTGDLFEPVPERFDVIVANPPLLPGTPENMLESAIFDPGLDHSRKFVEQVGEHLTDQGRAYLVATDAYQDLDIFDLVSYAEACGLVATPLARRHLPYETYTVYQLRTRCGR